MTTRRLSGKTASPASKKLKTEKATVELDPVLMREPIVLHMTKAMEALKDPLKAPTVQNGLNIKLYQDQSYPMFACHRQPATRVPSTCMG